MFECKQAQIANLVARRDQAMREGNATAWRQVDSDIRALVAYQRAAGQL